MDFDTPFSSVEGSPVVSLNTGDGVYNASFAPVLSGKYTVAVMLATQLEVQNITADVSARAGSFVLQVHHPDKHTLLTKILPDKHTLRG